MFDRLRARHLATKAASSLRTDSLQPVGWNAWLRSAASVHQLRAECSEPGWLVHLAYWSDVKQDALLDGAFRVANVVWFVPALANVLTEEQRERLLAWKTQPTRQLTTLVAELEESFPSTRAVLDLPGFGVTLVRALELMSARSYRDADPKDASAAEVGAVGRAGYRGVVPPTDEDAPRRDAAATGCALVAVAAMNREGGHRDALAAAVAGAVACFARACPSETRTMLDQLRSAYGWQVYP